MGMHVHKTRRSHKACSVDDLRAFRRQIMPHRSNQAPFEQQLARLVPPTGGVDYPRAADQFLPIRFPPILFCRRVLCTRGPTDRYKYKYYTISTCF